jgi:hypothetical protein
MKTAMVAVLAAAAAIGCGGSSGGASGLVSCTISESIGGVDDGGIGLMLCEEASGAEAQQIRQACMTPGLGADAGFSAQAQFVNGPCSRVGAAGGCKVTNQGVTATAWYYTMGGFTPDLIMQLCASAGGMFIAP